MVLCTDLCGRGCAAWFYVLTCVGVDVLRGFMLGQTVDAQTVIPMTSADQQLGVRRHHK